MLCCVACLSCNLQQIRIEYKIDEEMDRRIRMHTQRKNQYFWKGFMLSCSFFLLKMLHVLAFILCVCFYVFYAASENTEYTKQRTNLLLCHFQLVELIWNCLCMKRMHISFEFRFNVFVWFFCWCFRGRRRCCHRHRRHSAIVSAYDHWLVTSGVVDRISLSWQ